MNNSNAVFFSRCRPQNCDAIDLVLQKRLLFIGWPAWRTGIEPQRGKLREAIIDLHCTDEDWASFRQGLGPEGKQYQQNRNFVQRIDCGAIALVPRPERGVVYAGRVTKRFELLDDPPWGDAYLNIRREQELLVEDDMFSHLADVANCCTVDCFRALPFPIIPAWIRRSLLGRSTYGQIYPLAELNLDPHSILNALLDHPERAELPWTSDLLEIERRLVDGVGPNSFEHLSVALLQLEHPTERWTHVGGSGDGGVDGIGSDSNGTAVGILQCKWAYSGEQVFNHPLQGIRRVLTSLIHEPQIAPGNNVEFWPRSRIATLVLKHASRLPLATTLRVVNPEAEN